MSEEHSSSNTVSLSVLRVTRKDARGHWWGVCLCACGKEKEMRLDGVRSGRKKSCGCKRSRIGRTHGHCREDGAKARTYRAWASMLSRCNNSDHKSYAGYGGRGIRVCDKWSGSDGYPNFLADMGQPGNDESLDRIDNNGPYSPENCRWATRSQQQRNTRKSRLFTLDSKTQPLSVWAAEAGLEYMTVSQRLQRGWTLKQAITTPAQKPRKGLKRKREF